MHIPFRAIVSAVTLAWSTATLAAPILIQDVAVFDGEHLQAHRSVLVDGAKIVDADFRSNAPAGATVVPGAGRTLLPGLIDSHVHAYRHFELPLLFGVTTQLDMFTGVQIMRDATARMVRGENAQQADLFSAGTLATAPGGHGTEYGLPIPTLTQPAEAQAWVDARIAEGSAYIKIVMEAGYPGHPMNTLDYATVKALIDAAHQRGKMAVAHISNLADASAAISMGVDGLAHLFNGPALPQAEIDKFVMLAKSHKVFVIPTFSVLESVAGFKEEDILADKGFTDLLDKEQVQALQASYGTTLRANMMEAPAMVTAALAKAGVPVLAGTDAGNAGTQYGASLHHELAQLVKAGMTTEQALAAATSVPAQAFHLGQRGRIANGYKADLLLVEGNPVADITATRRIVAVWKDGVSADGLRDKQRALVAQEKNPASRTPLALPEDGRISLFSKDKLASPIGFGWGPSVDAMMGGKSTVQLTVADGAVGGQHPLAVDATVSPGFPYPWAGVAFLPGAQPMQAADLSAARVLRFRVKGDGKAYAVAMMSKGVSMPSSVPFTAGPSWHEVSIPLANFKGIDAGALTMIAFNAGPTPGDYHFQIADVRLMTE